MTSANTQSPSIAGKFLPHLSLLCLALMCVLPFQVPHHRPPLTTFYGEWLAAGLGLAAAVFLLRPRAESFHFPRIAWVPLSVVLLLLLQVMLGMCNYWQQHFLVGLYLCWAALMMILGAQLRLQLGEEKVVPVLAWALLGGSLLSVIMLILSITEIPRYNRLLAHLVVVGHSSNLGQVNHFANYLGLGLGSLLYLWLTRRINSGPVLMLASILLLALAFTGQRMAVLYVLLLSVGGWLLARKSIDSNMHGRAKNLFWLIPAFIAAQIILPLLPINVPTMPGMKVVESMQGSSVRLMYLQQAWNLFLSHPLLGAGWGEFGWHNFQITEMYPEQKGYSHNAHNLVLQLLAETGIVGAGVLLLGVLIWLWKQFGKPLSPERWWLLVLLSITAIHSLLEYPLWYAYFLGLAALMLGLGEEGQTERRFVLAPVLFSAVLVFGTVSLGNLFSHYYTLEDWFTQGRRGQIQKSETNAILNDMMAMRQHSLLTPYADALAVRLIPDSGEFVADKLAINTRVMKFQTGKTETFVQAGLLALNDQPQAAKAQLKKAMKQFPEYIETYRGMIQRQVRSGDKRLLPLLEYMQIPKMTHTKP